MGANAQTSVPAFTSGQVLTAAQVTQINTGIPVFASSTERDAAFGGAGEKTLAEGQMAYLEDTNETQVYDGSAWAAVGGGKILQIVSTTKTDTFSASVALGASTDITGLSVNITPTSVSSTIYVVGVVHFANVNTYGSGAVTLVRDSTAIGVGTSTGSRTAVTGASIVFSGGNYDMLNTMISHVDSPATTSATTYKLQLTNATRAGVTSTMYVNRNNDDADLNRTPRPVSTITVMEVSA